MWNFVWSRNEYGTGQGFRRFLLTQVERTVEDSVIIVLSLTKTIQVISCLCPMLKIEILLTMPACLM